MGHGKMGLKSLVFMIAFVSIIIRIHPLYKVTSLTEGLQFISILLKAGEIQLEDCQGRGSLIMRHFAHLDCSSI